MRKKRQRNDKKKALKTKTKKMTKKAANTDKKSFKKYNTKRCQKGTKKTEKRRDLRKGDTGNDKKRNKNTI